MNRRLLALAGAALLLPGCVEGQRPAPPAAGPRTFPGPDTAQFQISSADIEAEGSIPVEFTCDGRDVSPQIAWSGAPEETRSYAIHCWDEDAPGGAFVHWLAWNIDAGIREIPQGGLPSGGMVHGANDFGRTQYNGPCPPGGDEPHRYRFDLYALDLKSLDLSPGARYSDLETAIQGHLLARARFTARYARK